MVAVSVVKLFPLGIENEDMKFGTNFLKGGVMWDVPRIRACTDAVMYCAVNER